MAEIKCGWMSCIYNTSKISDKAGKCTYSGDICLKHISNSNDPNRSFFVEGLECDRYYPEVEQEH